MLVLNVATTHGLAESYNPSSSVAGQDMEAATVDPAQARWYLLQSHNPLSFTAGQDTEVATVGSLVLL